MRLREIAPAAGLQPGRIADRLRLARNSCLPAPARYTRHSLYGQFHPGPAPPTDKPLAKELSAPGGAAHAGLADRRRSHGPPGVPLRRLYPQDGPQACLVPVGRAFADPGGSVRSRWCPSGWRNWPARLGQPCFAEQFIEGREFNLSLLGDASGPQVLPPAEIDFSAFPPGKPRVVGQRAKWHESSFEFSHTPPRFDFPPTDEPLLDHLRNLAGQCWELFGLRGYVRVDFRVDARAGPGFWRSTPILASRPTPALPRQSAGQGFPLPMQSNGSWPMSHRNS